MVSLCLAGFAPDAAAATCGEDVVVDADGRRRLALVVGVADYFDPQIPDLRLPEEDARAFAAALTAPSFGIPPANVCLLVGRAATEAAVEDAFARHLIAPARAGDQVIFYFAGHGTQIHDLDGDEADGLDESLLLHDSGREGGLSDDVLRGWLAALQAQTGDVVLVVDACTSGSIARGGDLERGLGPSVAGPVAPVAAPGWAPEDVDGLVVLSAAMDGSKAYEPADGAHGRYTGALLGELGRASRLDAWHTVAARAELVVGRETEGRQHPWYAGATDRALGGGLTGRALVVRAPGRASGAWLPGVDVGAVVDVVTPDGAALRTRVVSWDGMVAGLEAEEVPVGSAVTVAVPAPLPSLPLAVVAGGADVEVALAGARVVNDPAARLALVRGAAGLQLVRDGRVVWPSSVDGPCAALADAIECHRVQHVVRTLQGTSEVWVDDQAIEVSVVVDASSGNGWRAGCVNGRARVPVCAMFEVQVANKHPSLLQVTGLLLLANGEIVELTASSGPVVVPPDASPVPLHAGAARATPPLDLADEVVVFGHDAEVPMDWSAIVDRGMVSAHRGGGFTVSHLQIEAVANAWLRAPAPGCEAAVGPRQPFDARWLAAPGTPRRALLAAAAAAAGEAGAVRRALEAAGAGAAWAGEGPGVRACEPDALAVGDLLELGEGRARWLVVDPVHGLGFGGEPGAFAPLPATSIAGCWRAEALGPVEPPPTVESPCAG